MIFKKQKISRPILLLLVALFYSCFLHAQYVPEPFVKKEYARVERSIVGAQISLNHLVFYNELGLSKLVSLRLEGGLQARLGVLENSDDLVFLFVPELAAEARWYFNLQTRIDRGQNTQGNSGEFFSLKISYHPDWFVIPNIYSVYQDIIIMPKWGLRRVVSKKWDIEIGGGLGYRFYPGYTGELLFLDQFAINITGRMGYRF